MGGVLEGRSEPLDEIVAAGDALVLLFYLCIVGARHGLDEPVKIWIAKVRNAIAWGEDLNRSVVWWLDDTMDSTFDGIIAPACEQVTSVDDNGVWDRYGVYKLTRG